MILPIAQFLQLRPDPKSWSQSNIDRISLFVKNLFNKIPTLINSASTPYDFVEVVEKKIVSEGYFLAFPINFCPPGIVSHYCPNSSLLFSDGLWRLDLGFSDGEIIIDVAQTYSISSGSVDLSFVNPAQLICEKAIKSLQQVDLRRFRYSFFVRHLYNFASEHNLYICEQLGGHFIGELIHSGFLGYYSSIGKNPSLFFSEMKYSFSIEPHFFLQKEEIIEKEGSNIFFIDLNLIISKKQINLFQSILSIFFVPFYSIYVSKRWVKKECLELFESYRTQGYFKEIPQQTISINNPIYLYESNYYVSKSNKLICFGKP